MAGIPSAVLEAEARVNALMAGVNPEDGNGQETPPETELQPWENQEPPIEKVEDPTFEHKYNTLQGKYNAEMGRLNSALSELRVENADLRSRMAEFMASVQNNQTPQTHKSDALPEKVAQFKEELPDTFNSIQYVAGEMVKAEIEKAKRDINSQVEEVRKKVSETTQETFYDRLQQRVPNWEVLNNDPKFINWLERPDRYSGQTYLNMLRGSVAQGNVARAAAFFEDYISEMATPATPKKSGTEKFVAPRTSAAGGPPPGKEQEVITTSFIKKFGNDISAGRFKGRESEIEVINSRINAAQAAGKVVIDT